jgi:hypothetical protein
VRTLLETIEKTLQKYYALLTDSHLLTAEPMPQFNTHEVFAFPWIDTEADELVTEGR